MHENQVVCKQHKQNALISFSFLPNSKLTAIMKQSERRTNSVTCNVKSQCAEILIKGEDDADVTLKQQEHVTSPSPDPVVKVEENDVNLKNDVE